MRGKIRARSRKHGFFSEFLVLTLEQLEEKFDMQRKNEARNK